MLLITLVALLVVLLGPNHLVLVMLFEVEHSILSKAASTLIGYREIQMGFVLKN